jgi:hypothetical protein
MPYEPVAPESAEPKFAIALAKLAKELAKGVAEAWTRKAAPAVNRPRVPIPSMEGPNDEPFHAPKGTTPEWTTPRGLGGTANERNGLAGPPPAHGAVRNALGDER